MDHEAFTARYRTDFRLVWNLCLTFLHNVADTEDAVQETFVRLLNCPKSFESEEHVRAWLIRTARNVCRDELRRARRREAPLDEVGQVAGSRGPELNETLEAVRTLPENYRAAIYLYYYEGCSTAQIARLLERREATVRSDLRRGREQLKRLLERSEP